MYYAYEKNPEKAIENMKLFLKEDNYQYWILLFEREPAVASIKELPEFKKTMDNIKTKFWRTHEKIRVNLNDKRLLQIE